MHARLCFSLASRYAEQTLGPGALDVSAHAELAWAFVRWALSVAGDAVAEAVSEAFAAAERVIGTTQARTPGVDARALQAHGRLSPAVDRACQSDAWREVIAPCRDALLGEVPSSRVANASEGSPSVELSP